MAGNSKFKLWHGTKIEFYLLKSNMFKFIQKVLETNTKNVLHVQTALFLIFLHDLLIFLILF